jgi:hypothetical protein
MTLLRVYLYIVAVSVAIISVSVVLMMCYFSLEWLWRKARR